MKPRIIFLISSLIFSLSVFAAPPAKPSAKAAAPSAGMTSNDPVVIFEEGCKTELNTFCKDVTPGENRVLACIYAHEDKLSGRCEYALYDASAQLERSIAALSYLARECDDDIEKHCANVEPGQGRILACMKPHLKTVSKRCQTAMQDLGVK